MSVAEGARLSERLPKTQSLGLGWPPTDTASALAGDEERIDLAAVGPHLAQGDTLVLDFQNREVILPGVVPYGEGLP